jgi:hypothetical protein
VQAVNNLGEHGRWAYLVVEDPQKLGAAIDGVSITPWEPNDIELSQ